VQQALHSTVFFRFPPPTSSFFLFLLRGAQHCLSLLAAVFLCLLAICFASEKLKKCSEKGTKSKLTLSKQPDLL
jgi:hypothetical protein